MCYLRFLALRLPTYSESTSTTSLWQYILGQFKFNSLYSLAVPVSSFESVVMVCTDLPLRIKGKLIPNSHRD
jgi:hypothetical protein